MLTLYTKNQMSQNFCLYSSSEDTVLGQEVVDLFWGSRPLKFSLAFSIILFLGLEIRLRNIL